MSWATIGPSAGYGPGIDQARITPASTHDVNQVVERLDQVVGALRDVQHTILLLQASAAAGKPAAQLPPAGLKRPPMRPREVRLLAEKRDISLKLMALRAFVERPGFGDLPSEEREAMLRQLEAMVLYEDALTDRLRLWGLS